MDINGEKSEVNPTPALLLFRDANEKCRHFSRGGYWESQKGALLLETSVNLVSQIHAFYPPLKLLKYTSNLQSHLLSLLVTCQTVFGLYNPATTNLHLVQIYQEHFYKRDKQI